MDERQNPICSHCGQVIETDDYSFVHGEIVCHECVESDCIRCERCGELMFDEDAYGDDTHTLCRNCYDNFYTRCDNCDCVVHVDDTYNHDDDCLCYDCYQERERYIRDYSYKPEPIFYGKADRYFGVELEIDLGGRDSDNA
ncbi:MAG: zinc-binding protein, partial [Oscillospiraceae bacterium]|nr:zinc-binding protein [Oscillospiraceae bacterium]